MSRVRKVVVSSDATEFSSCVQSRRAWRHGVVILACLATFAPGFPVSSFAQTPKPDESGQIDDYNQWKLSLGQGEATPVDRITAPAGFRVERLRSARPEEGSWVALEFDPQGRLFISREKRGILRLTLPKDARPATVEQETRVEVVDDTLLECRGLLWAHDALYANANNSKGLYRLRDADGDGRFEEVKLLRATSGHVGHGRNDLTLGPDGLIYSIHGDDVRFPDDFVEGTSPYRNYADDRLLPCTWDKQLFNSIMQPPGGHLVRTDKEGKTWEIVAAGLRNPYGVDFNADGECFTYDADMEWDVGMPWYRATRVLHLTSGGEFGWRYGTGAWPDWYPDSWPTTLNIGLGSPTSVKFGTRSQFPDVYRRALFILDWSYGRIIAVHLAPHGASYTGREEPFLQGRPLNVTDLEFGPDGAMYFLTGGRGTQSGLYRVTYVGGESPAKSLAATAPTAADEAVRAAESRALRRRLETLHGRAAAGTVDAAWPHLDHADVWIRNAARTAIEHQPAAEWVNRALLEKRPRASASALLAAARLAPRERLPDVIRTLLAAAAKPDAKDQMTTHLRSLRLAAARAGQLEPTLAASVWAFCDERFPSGQPHWDVQLCELLVYGKSPGVVGKTLPLVATAKTQEEKVAYLYLLRHVHSPWTVAQRQTYFEWLREMRNFYGAQFLAKFVQFIREDAVATLSDQEKKTLGDLIEEPKPAAAATPASPTNRPFVRDWKLDDLVGSLDFDPKQRDRKRGERVFAEASCVKCHKLGGQGSPVGPDLSQVGRRFGRRDLLVSLIYPSHAIDEKYRSVAVTTEEGRVFIGRPASDDGQTLTLVPDLLQPEKVIQVPKRSVESQTPSLQSPMPAGLLNTFSKDEILDLLALLEGA